MSCREDRMARIVARLAFLCDAFSQPYPSNAPHFILSESGRWGVSLFLESLKDDAEQLAGEIIGDNFTSTDSTGDKAFEAVKAALRSSSSSG